MGFNEEFKELTKSEIKEIMRLEHKFNKELLEIEHKHKIDVNNQLPERHYGGFRIKVRPDPMRKESFEVYGANIKEASEKCGTNLTEIVDIFVKTSIKKKKGQE